MIASQILLLFFILSPHATRAYFDLPAHEPSGPVREMNGIKSDEYASFAENWHLVTVRFRQDTKEMRFVYANDLAYQAMKNVDPRYPDGAVFAKLGVVTEDDPAFTSSKVPSGTKRTQFMVKDSKKYSQTDGWGYALFDAHGNTFQDEPPARKTLACVACHRIVPGRDYVFSRPVFFSTSANSTSARPTFIGRDVKQAPSPLAPYLKGWNSFFAVSGELQKSVFSGTFDEIVPTLLEKAKQSSLPAALIADENHFSLVLPERGARKACVGTSGTASYRVLIVYQSRRVRDAKVCQ